MSSYDQYQKEQDRLNRIRDQRNQSQKIVATGFIILSLLAIVAGAVVGFGYYAGVVPQYNRLIGDYAKNAQDAPTFQQAITYLQKFNDSMNHEGLTVDMYNSAFGWDQTPQNRMDFQYSYVTQMIYRAQYYINLTGTAKPNAGVLTDVYDKALSNFRAEMDHNGPLDWVARNAWELKIGHYWDSLWMIFYIVIGIAGMLLSLWLVWPHD